MSTTTISPAFPVKSPTTTVTPGARKPYHGSCHCGATRYIAYLTLPPPLITALPPSPTSTIRLRKCNCSTCHKMSFFHVRLMDSPGDFLLLSPLDPWSELGDYTCFDGKIHWLFCRGCGVRCFAFMGEGEVGSVVRDWDLAPNKAKEGEISGEEGKHEEKGKEEVKVWRPKREGWVEKETGYLSVNAASLDQGQEGLDMREWVEKGWVAYLDLKGNVEGEARLGRPHGGGCY